MTIYSSPESYLVRELSRTDSEERANRRFELMLQALLIGPTCGDEASKLVTKIFTATPHSEVAAYLANVCRRYEVDAKKRKGSR